MDEPINPPEVVTAVGARKAFEAITARLACKVPTAEVPQFAAEMRAVHAFITADSLTLLKIARDRLEAEDVCNCGVVKKDHPAETHSPVCQYDAQVQGIGDLIAALEGTA